MIKCPILCANHVINRNIIIIDGGKIHVGINMFLAPIQKRRFCLLYFQRLMPVARSKRNAVVMRSLSYNTLREHALYRSPDVHPGASVFLHFSFADAADCVDSLLAKYVLFRKPCTVQSVGYALG